MHRVLGRASIVLALLAVAVTATVALGSDGPAQAAGTGTQVFFTPFGRVNPEPIIGFPNQPIPPILPKTLLKVDVRVKDVANSNGLGSFEFTFKFDSSLATVTVVDLGAFLGSTGRAVSCTPPTILPGSVNVSCNTLANSPDGPLGSGVLATITFQPAGALGLTSLTFNKTHLTDISGDVPIPHKSSAGSFRVAKCGDFDNNQAVTIGDILALIQKFGTTPASLNWDQRFDLDKALPASVNLSDLLIEVQEFGRNCTAT
jgi:hypothetical protein